MTEFPHTPERYRLYADEFVQAWREVSGNPAYRPSAADRSRIVAGSRLLTDTIGERPGFVLWAVPEHIRRLEKGGKGKQRYVASPWSVRWLFEHWDKKDKWANEANNPFWRNDD